MSLRPPSSSYLLCSLNCRSPNVLLEADFTQARDLSAIFYVAETIYAGILNLSVHTTWNGLIMLATIKPYRVKLLRSLRGMLFRVGLRARGESEEMISATRNANLSGGHRPSNAIAPLRTTTFA